MMIQLSIFDYPRAPGCQKRDTSHAAAAAARSRAKTLRDLALSTLKRSALTADEVAERLGETVLSIRPRVTELAARGLIKDSGARRKNASGKSAIVWRVA